MRASTIIRGAAAATLLLAPLAAHAQRTTQTQHAAAAAPVRDGLVLVLGLGAGNNGYECNGCASTRQNGGSGYLSIGRSVTRSVVVSGELNGWTHEESGTSFTTAFVGPTAQWYPSAEGGFFFKAGAGLGSVRLKDNTALSQDELLSRGFGYQAGLGYDLGITHRFALTPYAGYMGMSGSNASINGQSQNERLNGNFWHYGVGLTWH